MIDSDSRQQQQIQADSGFRQQTADSTANSTA
ncbi:hypothetical protein Tco_1526299, partial [Tanacetum coccineum]